MARVKHRRAVDWLRFGVSGDDLPGGGDLEKTLTKGYRDMGSSRDDLEMQDIFGIENRTRRRAFGYAKPDGVNTREQRAIHDYAAHFVQACIHRADV